MTFSVFCFGFHAFTPTSNSHNFLKKEAFDLIFFADSHFVSSFGKLLYHRIWGISIFGPCPPLGSGRGKLVVGGGDLLFLYGWLWWFVRELCFFLLISSPLIVPAS